MEIKHQDKDGKGMFYIELNGKIVGEMTYVWRGNEKIIIDHTKVESELNGKGAGKQLVRAAVDFARDKGIKIIPVCPFAKSVFDKVDEFKDVL